MARQLYVRIVSALGLVALAALFIAFLKVSLCSFGGGLVWARRVTVEQVQHVLGGAHRTFDAA